MVCVASTGQNKMYIPSLGWEIGSNHSKDLCRLEIGECELDSSGLAQFTEK
jgi:hypothetical protein